VNSSKTDWLLKVPRLTNGRIVFAFAVALAIDGVQLLTGPAGWLFIDEALDVVAMVLTSLALGFHPLLLPTFIIKLVPVADWLPTWTGCTAAVVVLRKRAQTRAASEPPRIFSPDMLPPSVDIPGQPPPIPPEKPAGE
jgi:hypothetical protein